MTSDGVAHSTKCGAAGSWVRNLRRAHQAALLPMDSGRPRPLLMGCWLNPLFMGQFPSLSLPRPPQLPGPLKTLAHGPFIQPQLVTLAHLADLGRLLGYLYDQSHHCGLSSFCDLLPRDTPQCWAGASAVTAQQGHGRARPHRIVFTLSLGCWDRPGHAENQGSCCQSDSKLPQGRERQAGWGAGWGGWADEGPLGGLKMLSHH